MSTQPDLNPGDDAAPGTPGAGEDICDACAGRGTLADGSTLEVAGTLAGTRMVPKVVSINGYEIEVPIVQHHVVMRYADRPGIVAIYGQKLGEAGINIAGLQVARPDASGRALSVLTVDSPIPEAMLDELRDAVAADLFRQIELSEV